MAIAAREAGFTEAETQRLLAEVSDIESSGFGTLQAHFLVRGTPMDEVVDRVRASLTAQTGGPAEATPLGKSVVVAASTFPRRIQVLVRPAGEEVLVMGIDKDPWTSSAMVPAKVFGLGGMGFGLVFGVMGLLLRLPALAALAATAFLLGLPIWLAGVVGTRIGTTRSRKRLARTLASVRALVLDQP